MSPRQLLVLGNLEGEALAALELACRNSGCTPVIRPKANDAILELDQPGYRGLLVDLTTPGAARFCHEARARRTLFNVPLIALSPKLTDLAFSNALRWGADDVVMLGASDALTDRLSAVPNELPPIATPTLGEAVIADPDRSRCDVLGRVLTNAGISVKYATDLVTARYYLPKPNVSLFVLNTEIGDASALIEEARSSGSRADWVVTTKTLDVDAVRSQLENIPQVVVMPSHGPPENVLFALNLLRPPAPEKRRDEIRALYGAVVLFRPPGVEREEFGFSYTVSPGGLYLRTLLPPPADRLWLEVTPPNVPRRVKLLARVAWSRTFGEAGAELAPPGFALRILDAPGDDLELWKTGFESLDTRTRAAGVQEVNTTSANASVSAFKVPLPSVRPGRISRVPALPTLLQAPTPTLSGRISRLPELKLRSTASGLGRTNTTGQNTTGQSSVVVPKSTWHPPEPTPKNAPVLPKPIVVSSQDAVLSAIRSSLLPPAVPESPVVTESPAVPESPDVTEPVLKLDAPTEPDPPDVTEPRTPVVPLAHEFEEGTWVPQRPVRTVLGMGGLGDLVIPAGALPSPPPLEDPELPALADTSEPHENDAEHSNVTTSIAPEAEDPTTETPILELADTERSGPSERVRPTPPPRLPSRKRATGEAAVELPLAEPPLAEPRSSLPIAGLPQKRSFVVPALVLAAVVLGLLVGAPLLWQRLTPPSTTVLPSPKSTGPLPSEAPPEAPAPLDDPTSPDPVAPVPPSNTGEATQTNEAMPPVEPQAAPTLAPNALLELSENHAYLFVRSSTSAQVYVHGVDVGETNQWLVSRCGSRFIRLGRAPGAWLSPGVPTKLRCRQANEIELQPEP